MRWVDYALIAATVTMAVIVSVAFVYVLMQPKDAHALKNAYWPYSVETVVRDR